MSKIAARFARLPRPSCCASARCAYTEHVYEYVDHGGTAESARQLGVDEHSVVKTLVMQDDAGDPLLVLMHGDCTVSTKNLARQIQRKRVEPCRPDVAQRFTGYLVGGTSPFGTRRAMPVYVERSVLALAADLHQRRAARLPGRYRAPGLDRRDRSDPGGLRPEGMTMPMLWTAAAILAAYLLGSVSFAVVVSRAFGLADPRTYGSKNPGATNVLRSGSKLAAILTLVGRCD